MDHMLPLMPKIISICQSFPLHDISSALGIAVKSGKVKLSQVKQSHGTLHDMGQCLLVTLTTHSIQYNAFKNVITLKSVVMLKMRCNTLEEQGFSIFRHPWGGFSQQATM